MSQYFRLRPGEKVGRTWQVDESILVDLDEQMRVVGIEILGDERQSIFGTKFVEALLAIAEHGVIASDVVSDDYLSPHGPSRTHRANPKDREADLSESEKTKNRGGTSQRSLSGGAFGLWRLREDLVETFGAAGAHVDLLDELIKRSGMSFPSPPSSDHPYWNDLLDDMIREDEDE